MDAHGEVLIAISDGIVALLKEFYGRGPTRTKSYYQDDLVVCLLRGGFSLELFDGAAPSPKHRCRSGRPATSRSRRLLNNRPASAC